MMPTLCNLCGNIIPEDQVVFSKSKAQEGWNIFCTQCFQLFGHCHTCVNLDKCGFFGNVSDPLPQQIQVQQTQRTPTGVVTTIKQTPNPERIKKYCTEGKCACCNETDQDHPFCCRFTGFGTCENYQENTYEIINQGEE